METGAVGVAEGTGARVPVRRLAVPRVRRRAGAGVPRLAALSASLLLLGLLVVGAVLLATAGTVLPGTRVADVPVGGLDEAAALARVEARVGTLAGQTVGFGFGDRTWTASPAEIGVTYDAAASVADAMSAGRERGGVGGFLRAARLARDPITVPLAIRFDGDRFARFVAGLEAELGSPPVDATLALDGTAVSVTPARAGRGFDRDAARTALLPLLADLRPAAVTLTERAVPATIGDDRAAALKTRLESVLAEPTLLRDGDDTFPVTPDDLAGLVRVAPVERDGLRTLDATLDDAGLKELTARIAAAADAATSDAWVEDRGDQRRLVPSVRGRTVRQEELVASLRTAFATGAHELPLPIDPAGAEPATTTDELLADLGVTELIATGDSDFSGSDAGRDANVRLAAERVDGALIPPGGSFSYNTALGTLFDSGFGAAASMIEGFETAEGGGVCQVSTTIFRAALRAGLPIGEWYPHSFRSPFYEQGGWSPGYDASIVQVWQQPEDDSDFRFENPTAGWMLVRVIPEGGSALRVELLGTDPGYEVGFDEPVQEVIEGAPPPVDEVDETLPPGTVVEDVPAADAVEVTVVRRVYDADGNEVFTDTFVSPYKAQPALRRVSPDMAEGL